jgi:hypothetical protein
VVIDAELGREYHGSILATVIGRELEPLDVITDPRNIFNLWRKPKKKKKS